MAVLIESEEDPKAIIKNFGAEDFNPVFERIFLQRG
jgi:hypothetical protein